MNMSLFVIIVNKMKVIFCYNNIMEYKKGK